MPIHTHTVGECVCEGERGMAGHRPDVCRTKIAHTAAATTATRTKKVQTPDKDAPKCKGREQANNDRPTTNERTCKGGNGKALDAADDDDSDVGSNRERERKAKRIERQQRAGEGSSQNSRRQWRRT